MANNLEPAKKVGNSDEPGVEKLTKNTVMWFVWAILRWKKQVAQIQKLQKKPVSDRIFGAKRKEAFYE